MRQFTFLAVLIIFLLISCHNYNKNQTINVDNKNIRIISLAPSITRILAELDQTKNIVGISSYCFLAETHKNLVLGNLIELNIERILLLKPDIVFLTEMVNKSDLNTLQRHGIRTYILPKLTSFDDIIKNYYDISVIINEENLANRNIEIYKAKIDSLQNIVKIKNKRPKIFFQISSNPIFGVIPNTFMDDLIKFSGGVNILSELKHPIISREFVILKNPDIIFIADMGKPAKEELEKWKNYQNLNASRNNKIFIINPDTACQPTPLNFLYTLEKMIKFIYE